MPPKRKRTGLGTWWGLGARPIWPATCTVPRIPEDWANSFSYLAGVFEEAPTTHHTHIQFIVQSRNAHAGHTFLIKKLGWPKAKAFQYLVTGVGQYVHSKPQDAYDYVLGPYDRDGKHKSAEEQRKNVAFEYGIFDPHADDENAATTLAEVKEEIRNTANKDDLIHNVKIAKRYFHQSKMCDLYWEETHKQVYHCTVPEAHQRPWMHEVTAMLSGPAVSRRIIWIWSNEHTKYKTCYMNAVAAASPGHVLLLEQVPKELRHIYPLLTRKHTVIWIDFPRENTQEMRSHLCSILESLSNHGWKECCYNKPISVLWTGHVVVTCNFQGTSDQLQGRITDINVD